MTDKKNLLLIAISFLFFCLAAMIVLFAAGKGNTESSHWLIPALRTMRYHAALIVGLTLAASLAAAGTAFFSSPIPHPILSARENSRALGILFLFAFSMIPIGNLYRYQSLFYENWMWYCVFWILGLCLASTVAIYLILFQPSVSDWLGDRFAWAHRFLSRERFSGADVLFIVSTALLTLLETMFVSHFVLGDIPHVQDSLAQVFQAKVFAHGRMALPAPTDPEFFERIYIVAENGRWYSIYPPGFAMVLSLGMLIGKPYWVNPFVSAAIVPLTFLLAARHVSLYAARLGALFLSLSLFFITMGSGFMNHPICLLFMLLFLLFFFEASPAKDKRLFLMIPAGFFWGMGYLSRPMTALAFLAAAGVWILTQRSWKEKRLWLAAAVFLIGTLPPAVFYLMFNAHTTGSPWLMGYIKYFGGNPLGFGLRPWGAKPLGPRIPNEVFHSPMRGMANTNAQLNGLNYFLFGWPIPSLTWAFLLFGPGMRRRGFDRFCAGVIASVLFVYFFYFFQDYCYGPRFVYETIPFCILLTARGIEETFEKAKGSRLFSEKRIAGLIYPALAIFFLAAFSTAWVERINVMSKAYWGANPAVADMVRHGVKEENAVIFVDDPQDYVAVYSFLNPGLDKGWIVAHNLGAKRNERLLNRYPGWPVYRLRLQEAERGYKTVLEKYDPALSVNPE